MGTRRSIARLGLVLAMAFGATVARATISLVMPDIQTPVAPVSGETVTYMLTVVNTGDEDVTDLLVVDTVVPELTAVTVDQDPAFAAGLSVTSGATGTVYAWSATGLTMSPGMGYTFSITGAVGLTCQPTTVVNTMRVSASGVSPVVEAFASSAGFGLGHAYEVNLTPSGDRKLFVITVKNLGTATVMDITVTDTLPPTAVVFASSEPAPFGPAASVSVPGSGTLFVWSAQAVALPPLGLLTFTLSATPECSSIPFTVTLTAFVTGGTGCGSATATSPSRVWVQTTDTMFSATPTGWAGDSWAVLWWHPLPVEYDTPIAAWQVWRSADGSTYVPMGFEGVDTGGTLSDVDTRAFWDQGLTNGVAYSYRLQALTACGASAFSDPPTIVTPMTATALVNSGQSGVVSILPGTGYVKLSWPANPYPEPTVDRFYIHRLLSAGGPSTTIMTVIGAGVTYDYGLVNGLTYWYMVVPCCPNRRPSFLSGVPMQPARGQGQPTARMDPSGPRAVRLDWLSALDGTFTPLAGYAIFRSDDGGSSTLLAGSVPASQLTFVDLGVPAYGRRYVYIIRPIDAAGYLGDAYPTTLIDVILPMNRTFPNRNRMRPALGERVEIIYQITEPGRLRVSVWTQAGEFVKKLYDQEVRGRDITVDIPYNSHNEGLPPLTWDGTNGNGELVASGVYLIVLEVNGKRDFRKVAVVR